MAVGITAEKPEAFGNTGFTYDQVLTAGQELAADTLRIEPYNIAFLNRGQFDVVLKSVLTAEEVAGEGRDDIHRILGATWLLDRARR